MSFSLFAEVKYWSYKNSVRIRSTDFGAFRYHEKKDCQKNDVYSCGKESYADSRGYSTLLGNRRPERLRSRVRELDQVLEVQKVIWSSPQPDGFMRLITATGLVINLKTNLITNALQAVKFDRYLVGKISEICDVACTKTHLIFSHAENHLTLVNFLKPLSSASSFEKLSKLDPKLQVVELVGGSGRRLHRRVSANTSGDSVLTWWQTSSHEVYPWAPIIKDCDRANVHIYNLTGTQLDLVAYFRTESEPVSIHFSSVRTNIIWAIEQKVTRKGEVTVESCCYQLVKRQLVKKTVTSTPLLTHVSCHAFSPDENRLALGCIDGSLVVLDMSRGVTRQARAAFIPTLLRWHNDGALLFCANDRAQLQFFDLGLSCVRSQLLSEDVTPSNLLDLGIYFTSQPALLEMSCSFKESVPFYGCKYVPNDCCLLLIFEGGPIASLSLVGGGGLAGDIHSSGLTPDTLVSMYLTWQQVDKAIGILLSLDWNKEGAQCLSILYRITNAIFTSPLTPESEMQLETSLGCFHSPIRPLASSVYYEFVDQVHDLTRRFFHQLVRHGLYEKAFCLSLDLNDQDLYLDLLECSRRLDDQDMAAALHQQLDAFHQHTGSADSSCSCSSGSDDDHSLPPLPSVKKVPLPPIPRFGRLRESAFFSRTQSAFSMIPEEPSPTPPLPALPPSIVDATGPSVIDKLYDLSNKTKLLERTEMLPSTQRKPLSEVFKPSFPKSSPGTLSSTVPYVPMSTTHFSSILGPSSSLSAPAAQTTTQLPSAVHTFGFSSKGQPSYLANPLSLHLYGASSKAADQKTVGAIAAAKPKVKFSDTVTQIVVPDISELSGDKPRRVSVKGIDPARELADSLPLCLGNKDYLKNFSKADEDEEVHGATIKVIHFGVV